MKKMNSLILCENLFWIVITSLRSNLDFDFLKKL